MISWVRAALCGAVLSLAALGQASAGDREVHYGAAPWWVQPLSLPAPAPSEPGTPLAIVLNDSQSYFTESGSQFYYAIAAKVLTTDGLRPLGAFSEDWNPETETITIHHVLIHRGEETIDALASDRFSVLQREKNLEQAAVDGRLTASLLINGLQVGDTLDLAFTIDRRNPVLAGREGEELHLATFGTAARIHWRALWPQGRLMRWRTTSGILGVTPRETDGGTELVVDLQNVRSPVLPDNAPGRYADVAGWEMTGFATWAEVSQTLEPAFRAAATLDAASPLHAEAARIAAQTSDPVRRAELALRLVEEKTRYVFIGMNLGGYAPAGADETWRRRFGDCKGKTVLLLALLHDLGIKAEASLVSTTKGDGLDKHLPRLELFDHVLVRAEIDGRSYWLDGTRPQDGPLTPITVPPYRWTLPLREGGALLEPMVQTPAIVPGGDTVVTIDATAGLDAPMPVSVQLITQGDGAIALNRQFAGVSRADMTRTVLKSAAKLYTWVNFDKADWSFDPERLVLTISFSGVGKDASGRDKTGLRQFEVDNSSFGDLKTFVRDETQPQDAAFVLPFPAYERWTTMLKLPGGGRDFTVAGSSVDEVTGGIELKRHAYIDHGALIMTRSVRTLVPEVSGVDAAAANRRALEFAGGVIVAKQGGQHLPESAVKDAIDQTRLAMRDGDYDGSVRAYDQAIRLAPQPTSGRLLGARAAALVAGGHDQAALDSLNTNLKTTRDPADIYALRGLILHRQKKDELAAADVAAALALDPNNAEALRTRALLHRDAGQTAAALSDLEGYATRLAGEPDVLDALALFELDNGRATLAYSLYDEASRIDPFDQAAVAGRALADQRRPH
jgi:hypothetical protein